MSNLIFIILVILLVWWAVDHYSIIQRPTGGINRQVLQATRGDRDLAQRLMRQVRLRYPDKDEQWHVEKVLYDLERDRGYIPRRRTISMPRFNFNRNKRRNMLEDMFFISTLIWFLEMISHYVSDIFRR